MDSYNAPPTKFSEKHLLERIEKYEIEVLLESDFSKYVSTETREKLVRMIADNNWC